MASSFAEAMIKFTADGGGLNKQLSGIERAIRDSANRMSSAAKTAFIGVGGAIAAAIGPAAIVLLTKASADAGDEIMKMSQRVAISVETLSGYKLAAELADVSLGDFGISLQRASKNILEASQGSGDAADAFDSLGIRVTDSSGKLKTAEQVMLEVADRFKGMEDGAQKTALAMQIFGRGGAVMIPLLNQGSEALAAQRKEVELLGAGWTTAQAGLAEKFNDNLKRIQFAFAGFRNAVSTYLLPFVNEIIESILAKIKEWGASGELKIWALSTGEFIIGAFVKVIDAIKWVINLLPFLEDAFKAVAAQMADFGGTVTEALSQVLGAVGHVLTAIEKIPIIGPKMTPGLEEAKKALGGVAGTLEGMAEGSRGLGEALRESIGQPTRWVEKLTSGMETLAGKVREWGAAAIATGSKALAGIAETSEAAGKASRQFTEVWTYQVDGVAKEIEVSTKKAIGAMLLSAEDQAKLIDAEFKALKTRGEVSLQDAVNYYNRRAQIFGAGSADRIQAEADAFKAAQDMSERLFAHDQALGQRSLQDEIARLKQKAAAAVAGSEARMKAEEDVYKKEEDLRNKARSEGIKLLEEVQERLAARGAAGTKENVASELALMQRERSRQIAESVGRFAAGGAVDLGTVIEGLKAAGKFEEVNKLIGQFGGVEGIFAQGAAMPSGPSLTETAQGVLTGRGPGGGIAAGFQTGMDSAADAVKSGLTKIEGMLNDSSSRIARIVRANIEEWLVQQLFEQSKRGATAG